jgi:hypothetical protein
VQFLEALVVIFEDCPADKDHAIYGISTERKGVDIEGTIAGLENKIVNLGDEEKLRMDVDDDRDAQDADDIKNKDSLPCFLGFTGFPRFLSLHAYSWIAIVDFYDLLFNNATEPLCLTSHLPRF